MTDVHETSTAMTDVYETSTAIADVHLAKFMQFVGRDGGAQYPRFETTVCNRIEDNSRVLVSMAQCDAITLDKLDRMRDIMGEYFVAGAARWAFGSAYPKLRHDGGDVTSQVHTLCEWLTDKCPEDVLLGGLIHAVHAIHAPPVEWFVANRDLSETHRAVWNHCLWEVLYQCHDGGDGGDERDSLKAMLEKSGTPAWLIQRLEAYIAEDAAYFDGEPDWDHKQLYVLLEFITQYHAPQVKRAG